MLVAYATAEGCEFAIYLITGDRHVDILGNPTAVEWGMLAILAATLPLAAVVGWLVSRLSGSRTRTIAAAIGVAFAAVVGFIEDGPPHLLGIAVLVALVLILTACGVGAVLGWAVRMTLSHLTAIGTMAVKALPLVMLAVLMFFNTYAWMMAATISERRLWLALLFLLIIAAAFVISGTLERVRPMLRLTATLPEDSERLADTFCGDAGSAGPPPADYARTSQRGIRGGRLTADADADRGGGHRHALPCSRADPAQSSPARSMDQPRHQQRDAAGHDGPGAGSAYSNVSFPRRAFMYLGVRAVGDGEYRSIFLDPLVDDLHTTLIARNRYRGGIATAPLPVGTPNRRGSASQSTAAPRSHLGWG
jgi:hypothetical protein